MDRLTGDFKGASMFATVEQARIYNKLRQYEDTGLTPDEIMEIQRHRENNQTCYVSEAAEAERLRIELAAMTRRAECAISDLARAGLCDNCKHADSDECSETCGDSDSAYRWEWRVPKWNDTEDNTNETTTSPSAR